MACLTISLFLVVWLVWLLKVSHPLVSLPLTMELLSGFPFFFLNKMYQLKKHKLL